MSPIITDIDAALVIGMLEDATSMIRAAVTPDGKILAGDRLRLGKRLLAAVMPLDAVNEQLNSERSDQKSKQVRFVNVTEVMQEAGVLEMLELAASGGHELSYIALSVYMAMEYQRLESEGQLSSLFDNAL